MVDVSISKFKLIPLLCIAIMCMCPSLGAEKIAQISPFGTYPQDGDSFLYLADGGYATLPDAEVDDIVDYSTTSFSIEAIVDVRAYRPGGNWASIMSKTHRFGLYNKTCAGWGIGFSRQCFVVDRYNIWCKVGDGTVDVCVSYLVQGTVHLAMTWNCESKELKLYVDGASVASQRNPDIKTAMIDTNCNLMLGNLLSEISRNILMVRWWKEVLSSEKVCILADAWLKNGEKQVPSKLSTANLHSEWLMDKECASDGSEGIGYLKDNRCRNHLKFIGNTMLKVSKNMLLSLVYPIDCAKYVNKSVTLRAIGGDKELGKSPAHPLFYYFQIDTTADFDSAGVIESGWIPHYAEYMPILNPNTTYYWRVRVKDARGNVSDYSQNRSFTTESRSTWYVRPDGGNYGKEDGTSYNNAWNGLLNIVWGEHGVEPGDTLYICGLHVHDVTAKGDIVPQGDLYPISSGASESDRITIRGDYPSDPGIIWGAYRMSYEHWTDEGDGVWSIHLPGDSYRDWYFQDIGRPSNESFVILDKEISIEGVRNHPGSHYSSKYTANSLLYVKCTDSKNPAGRIYGNRWGYKFKLSSARYLTFLNIRYYNPYWHGGASHIRWEGCTMSYGESSLLALRDGQDFMEVINCDLSWADNGIYNISGTNNAPSKYVFRGNYIHDIGVRETNQNGDAHAIGIQGGHDGVIEDNIINNCGTGPMLYAFTSQELKNTIVRRNLVMNLHTRGGANGFGISTQCNNNSLSDKSGNEFYYNIVTNSPVAYRFQFEHEQKVFNNIACNCEIALASSRNFQWLGANVNLKNNIFFGSRDYHIKWYSGANNFTINADHNLYYPITGNKFRLASKDLNFKMWKASAIHNCIFDPSSLNEHPLFRNASGTYSSSSDFTLQPYSPAIDRGVSVGLTKDFIEASIAGSPDIGAMEFMGNRVNSQ